MTLKKGKVKLPFFCGNGERVVTIYGWYDSPSIVICFTYASSERRTPYTTGLTNHTDCLPDVRLKAEPVKDPCHVVEHPLYIICLCRGYEAFSGVEKLCHPLHRPYEAVAPYLCCFHHNQTVPYHGIHHQNENHGG